jgi:hypothetical protein
LRVCQSRIFEDLFWLSRGLNGHGRWERNENVYTCEVLLGMKSKSCGVYGVGEPILYCYERRKSSDDNV